MKKKTRKTSQINIVAFFVSLLLVHSEIKKFTVQIDKTLSNQSERGKWKNKQDKNTVLCGEMYASFYL